MKKQMCISQAIRISQLSDEDKAKALKGLRRISRKCHGKYHDYRGIPINGFSWYGSLEGQDFWDNVCLRLNDLDLPIKPMI